MTKWLAIGFTLILLGKTAYEMCLWNFDNEFQLIHLLRSLNVHFMIAMAVHQYLVYFLALYIPFTAYAFYLKVIKWTLFSLGLVGLQYFVFEIGSDQFDHKYNGRYEYNEALFMVCFLVFVVLPWVLVWVIMIVVSEVNRIETENVK